MECCVTVKLSAEELSLLGNLVNKRYLSNIYVLENFNQYTPDDYDAISIETELLLSVIKKIENYGHYFKKVR